MTRSELIRLLSEKYGQLPYGKIKLAVDEIVELMVQRLCQGERIELRDFGSFAIRYRVARQARNPRTGQMVEAKGRAVPHFKPGKEMRLRVNARLMQEQKDESQ